MKREYMKWCCGSDKGHIFRAQGADEQRCTKNLPYKTLFWRFWWSSCIQCSEKSARFPTLPNAWQAKSDVFHKNAAECGKIHENIGKIMQCCIKFRFSTDGLSTFPSVLVEKYSSADYISIKSPSAPAFYPCCVGKSVFFPRRVGSFSDMPHLYSVDTPWLAGVLIIDEKSFRFPRLGIKMPLLWEKSADLCPLKRENMPQKSLSDNVGAFFWGQIPKIFRSDGQNDGFLFVKKAISPPRWMRGGIFSQFPKPISQVRSRTIRVIIQVIAEIFCFLLFQKRFSSHAT